MHILTCGIRLKHSFDFQLKFSHVAHLHIQFMVLSVAALPLIDLSHVTNRDLIPEVLTPKVSNRGKVKQNYGYLTQL